MIIDYDHNQNLNTDRKLDSLKESVQMALNENDAEHKGFRALFDKVSASFDKVNATIDSIKESITSILTMLTYSYDDLSWATGTAGTTLRIERWGRVRTLTILNPTKLATGTNVVYTLSASDRPSVSTQQVLIQPVGAIANGGIFLSIRVNVQTNGNIELYNYRSSAINGNTNQSGTLTWIV